MHRVLEGIVRNQRAASAYLFVGPPVSGKLEDALAFADSLGCQKIDLLRVVPDGAYLKIDQVREISRFVRYGPSAGPAMCVIVERADTMTAEAAGAFLKTLEEPPDKVVFILLVEREDRIFPTIASRCQRIIFGEQYRPWQAKPELAEFYDALKSVKRLSVIELFGLSARLEKAMPAGRQEKERLEELLYELAFCAREELGNAALVRVILEAVRNLKKRSNVRLALDVMCLKLNEV
jgi:DNA polymerase III, delta subunit